MLTTLLSLTLMTSASAGTILVDPSDTDGNAHATIQSAVDAAGPGDTIVVAGGVYLERVHIRNGGAAGNPLILRAATNETVLINAGSRLDLAWEPAEGLAEVFVAEITNPEWMDDAGIWEMPTRLRLAAVAGKDQVAGRLGSWYFDSANRRLYIRGTGGAAVPERAYWLEDPAEPAVKVTADHVRIENLQVTLGQHGILVDRKTSHVTVADCRAFCNSWAGIHVTGDNHLITGNETFQNNTYGILLRYGVNGVRVANNLCYFNGPNNGEATGSSIPNDLGIYSQGEYNVFEGNIVEGIHEDVYRNKTGHGASQTNILRNNVIRGDQTPGPYGVYDNTLLVGGLGMRQGMYRNGGPPSPMRTWEIVDPDGLQRASNLIHPLVQEEDPRFADPAYRDYRLQGDSPYFGRGAFPGRAPIFFVDPKTGSDTASGLSIGEAFATMRQALEQIPAAGTIYLLPGNYAEKVEVSLGGVSPEEPLRIRAHGKRPGVTLTGGLRVTNAPYVAIEGIEFQAKLEAENTEALTIRHCVFDGGAAGITAKQSPLLRVEHCTFSGNETALAVEQSTDVSVAQSLFVDCKNVRQLDADSAKTFFSGFNTSDKSRDDPAGLKMRVELDERFIPVNSPGEFATASVDFGMPGARTRDAGTELQVANLRVAGLSPQGATLLWDTPSGATFAEIKLADADGAVLREWEPEFLLQILAASFDMTKLHEAFFSSQRHAVVADLQPDTLYKANIILRDQAGNRSAPAEIAFTTPSAYAEPAVYYLSPEGSDGNDGRARERPWRTFAEALANVGPGDELVLLPGAYHETLRPRVSGTAERPITIRSEQPLGAVLDLAESLAVAVEILNANHIVVDGLLITNGRPRRSHCYRIQSAKGITIRNCEIDYPARSSFEKLRLGYSGVIAHRAPGLTVDNNLILCAVVGVAVSHSQDTRIENNTIIGEGNYGVVIIPGGKDESYLVKNNLFYRTVMGYKIGPIIRVFPPLPRLVSDYNLFFIPGDHKGTIGALPDTERLFPLSAWQEATGLDAHSIAVEPEFRDPDNRDFTLTEDSPGKGEGKAGRDPGRVR